MKHAVHIKRTKGAIKSKRRPRKLIPEEPKHTFKATKLVIILCLFILLDVFVGNKVAVAESKTQEASILSFNLKTKEASVSALASENEVMRQELEAIKAKYPNPTQQEIESYVKTIFGPDARVAIAISHHECGTWDKSYPKCHLKTSAEDSIGLFQINLYNSKQLIHAGHIPGNTIAEKELWLENPFNNTLYAYWVFKTSGFNPWSSYTNGAYKRDL